jgi:hypothetical protein
MRSIIILFFISIILFAPSCKKDYLNKTPDGDLTLDQIFTSPVYTPQFLSNIYSHIPLELSMVDDPTQPTVSNVYNGASDDIEVGYDGNFSKFFNEGNWNPTLYKQDVWTNSYNAIRKTNLFLENIDKLVPSAIADQGTINRWKGEAIFLRAFFHFMLARVYGPVPIIDRTINLDEDFLSFKRQPINKCVEFISTECDKALPLLDTRITSANDYGRPTKIAALALKARVLLYMASPLWNGNPDYSNFKDNEGVRLFPDADPSRWQTAATAAKACIDQAEAAGHKLYKSANPNDFIKNYQEIFYKNFNDEVFFTRNGTEDYNINAYSEPRGFFGAFWPILAPTQDLVDDYEMADGTQPITGYNADMTPIINPASGYTESGQAATETNEYVAGTRTMYVNRDPRFYASIRFTGMKDKWTRAVSPRTTPLQFWKLGLDGRTSNSSDFYSRTGYLLKKLTHPDFVMNPKSAIKHSWIFFRLAEQYLNYAEALNESQGPVSDVYKYVNLIRARVGMPALPGGLSAAEMRERIRHERRIELAFETHRYFDTHRWKIAEITDNKSIYGLDVNTTGYTMSSDAFYKRTVVENRVFQKKHYLWPVPQKELDKNHALVQNPGW